MTSQESIKEAVRTRYAGRAREAQSKSAGCCGGNSTAKSLYSVQEIQLLPSDANLLSLGCGNPLALAELHPGEVVLDLGSGAGLDVLLSARRVGPAGKAYGLDMTDEMLELARKNQRIAGLNNAEFLKGEMEDIPLPDASVDVIISNCVVNLSPDKARVLREAFRVLKPGGRLAVSDIVIRGEIPDAIRHDMEAWSGCIAGALTEQDYVDKLKAAGFQDISVETTHTYSVEDLTRGGRCMSLCALEADEQVAVASKFTSSFVRARKPG